MRMKKKFKKKDYIFSVVTKIDEDGGLYDHCVDPKDIRIDLWPRWFPVPDKPFGIKLPVFELGEILIIDDTYGREISGRQRKPSKWFVETETFTDIDKACKRACEVMKKL